jgi:hypothetical protein
MPTPRLTELLDREGIKYVTIQHSRAYTAQEVAAAAHVSARRWRRRRDEDRRQNRASSSCCRRKR